MPAYLLSVVCISALILAFGLVCIVLFLLYTKMFMALVQYCGCCLRQNDRAFRATADVMMR